MSGRLASTTGIGLAALGLLAARFALAAPAVTIDSGQLSGRTEENVSAYLGIPFAAAPVGAARWRPPARPAPWKGVRSAAEFGASCPQLRNDNGLGPWTSEYIISGPDSGRLPVPECVERRYRRR